MGDALLTSSVIHSFVHQQRIVSSCGFSSGLSTRRKAASPGSSEWGRSNHSLATWPQIGGFSSADISFLIRRMGFSWLPFQRNVLLFKDPSLECSVLGSLRAWSGRARGSGPGALGAGVSAGVVGQSTGASAPEGTPLCNWLCHILAV